MHLTVANHGKVLRALLWAYLSRDEMTGVSRCTRKWTLSGSPATCGALEEVVVGEDMEYTPGTVSRILWHWLMCSHRATCGSIMR
jgi:hypothetical protein